MNIRTWLSICVFAVLGGCASVRDAGVSTYEIAPLDNGTCCRVQVRSGREIGHVDARLTQTERGPELRFTASDVRAFEGQQIGAAVAGQALDTVRATLPEIVRQAVRAALGTQALDPAGETGQ
ncbi:MAG: hypothetical protein IT495_17160 [Gammaproteobacteria bacterium]|nr:hypothetical protein [Gammaproteobacteria bacterium]